MVANTNSQNDIGKEGKNLTLMVYGKIKEMMLNYEIVPGQRLIFNDLALRLGVSRTPVNSALGMLANEGFLDFIPNQGYRVHEITKEEAESLYDIRELLEVGAIGKAIEKWTPEKLEVLERQKKLYEKTVTEQVNRGRFTLDQEFHACIIQMSDNLYLADYFREVYQRTFLRHRIEGFRADRAREMVSEHEQIFQSINVRDVFRARELLQTHIRAGKEYIFSVIFG